MVLEWREILTVHDSADEQPHVEQSTRASSSTGVAGLAATNPARMVKSVMENFILT